MTISESTQRLVRQRARFRCEYCHYPEFLSTAPLTIDHILPKSLGGSDDISNLALACRRCNERHYNFTTGIAPQSGQEVALFHPRKQNWADHFTWIEGGIKVHGTTPIGRATCHRLDLNDERRIDRFVQKSRERWIQGNWHPPIDDPCP